MNYRALGLKFKSPGQQCSLSRMYACTHTHTRTYTQACMLHSEINNSPIFDTGRITSQSLTFFFRKTIVIQANEMVETNEKTLSRHSRNCLLLSHLLMQFGSLYRKQYGPRSGDFLPISRGRISAPFPTNTMSVLFQLRKE